MTNLLNRPIRIKHGRLIAMVMILLVGAVLWWRVFIHEQGELVGVGRSPDGHYECTVTAYRRFTSASTRVEAVLRTQDKDHRTIAAEELANDSAVFIQYEIEWDVSTGETSAAVVKCFNTGDRIPSKVVRIPARRG